MEIIPLIYFKHQKIHMEKNDDSASLDAFINTIDSGQKIYILDLDGIKKDKPNLCSFPKLSENYEIWIDSRPMDFGDIVDSFMAGANAITIRRNIWGKLDIGRIREITENGIYAEVDLTDQSNGRTGLPIYAEVDGLVIFNNKDQVELDYKCGSHLKELSSRHNTYVYETNPDNIYYWEKQGVKGLLVDIKKVEVFEKKWDLKQKSSSHLPSSEVEKPN